jgi:hypothetical protein
MKDLKNTLAMFSSTLSILYGTGSNLVLGGSNALKLHGLETGRKSNDVDIIIYRPTTLQMTILNGLRTGSPLFKEKAIDQGYPGRVVSLTAKLMGRSYKLDIILSDEKMPEDLLSIEFFKYPILVQSIKNIIEAKASYTKQVDTRGSQRYISEKDAVDLMTLKNLNFNL